MDDLLEQRVKDIEDLIADLPELMSLRLESVAAAQSETAARVSLLDKQMAMVLREMRDLRGGVTRMLLAQDKRIAAMEARLGAMETRFDSMEARLDGIEAKLIAHDELFGILDGQLSAMDTKLDAILSRLPRP